MKRRSEWHAFDKKQKVLVSFCIVLGLLSYIGFYFWFNGAYPEIDGLINDSIELGGLVVVMGIVIGFYWFLDRLWVVLKY